MPKLNCLPQFVLIVLNFFHLIACSCTYYTIRVGDTCYALGIVEALNPQISCNNLRPGQRVCVIVVHTCDHLYTIKYGDTCFSLGIVQALYQNVNCNNLKPGQQICVYNRDLVNEKDVDLSYQVCENNRYYKINNGDTCYSISKKFGYDYTNLIAINFWNLNCRYLQIGQVICV